MDKKTIETDADTVGIVFPVYYGELPVIIREFASKLLNSKQKYVFAVCTYGGAAMASLRTLRRVFRSNGGRLSAAYGIHLPQNSFYKPRENRQKLYAASKKRLEFIINSIIARRKGVFYSNFMLELLLALIHPIIIEPICRKAFAKATRMPAGTQMDKLVRSMDIGFSSNEKCSGCGTCSRVCPVHNIEIADARPVWLHHCENCLACYNWCPNKAIQGGITTKDYFYSHPNIKIWDIMKQKSNMDL